MINYNENVLPARLAAEQRLGRRSQASQQRFAGEEHEWQLAQARGATSSDYQRRIDLVKERLTQARSTTTLIDDRRWELELIRLQKEMDKSLKQISKNTEKELIDIKVTIQALETALGRQIFKDNVVEAFRESQAYGRVKLNAQ